jgi:hypothetical protein
MLHGLDNIIDDSAGDEAPHKRCLGWREWTALPEIGIKRLKCKVDTGARTSALHAFYVETYTKGNIVRVRFGIHPLQGQRHREIHCDAPVLDQRQVTDSGGHREVRVVIKTPICMGDRTWPIELTLTNRDSMTFRMLLGRTAIKGGYLVDPAASYLMGKPSVSSTQSKLS